MGNIYDLVEGETMAPDRMDRLVNRILYQLDAATLEERIECDDMSILPFLRRAHDSVQKRAMRRAVFHRARQLKNALAAMEQDDGAA